jgi:hypothetical protein
MLRLIISGGRDFNDSTLFNKSVEDWFSLYDPKKRNTTILCGMAKGADMLGWHYANSVGSTIPVVEYLANWELHGKSAGMIRNKEMAWDATHLLAFWDRKSKGTSHMIRFAKDCGLDVNIVYYGSTNSNQHTKTIWVI